MVETQLGFLSRGDEDIIGDVELKVKLNCHSVCINGLHHQSPPAVSREASGGLVQRDSEVPEE